VIAITLSQSFNNILQPKTCFFFLLIHRLLREHYIKMSIQDLEREKRPTFFCMISQINTYALVSKPCICMLPCLVSRRLNTFHSYSIGPQPWEMGAICALTFGGFDGSKIFNRMAYVLLGWHQFLYSSEHIVGPATINSDKPSFGFSRLTYLAVVANDNLQRANQQCN
jgi:hypothetical protein